MIPPDQLPSWVPGRLTLHNPEVGWDGVSVGGYRYPGSDVEVPGLRRLAAAGADRMPAFASVD